MYNAYKLDDLKQFAKTRNLKGYSGKNLSEIVKLLEKDDEIRKRNVPTIKTNASVSVSLNVPSHGQIYELIFPAQAQQSFKDALQIRDEELRTMAKDEARDKITLTSSQPDEIYELLHEHKSELFKLSRLGEIFKVWIKAAFRLPTLATLIEGRDSSAPIMKTEIIYKFDKLDYFSTLKTSIRLINGKSILNLDIRISNDGFLYPRDEDSGLEIIQSGISRHRNIPGWSAVKRDSAKIHFAPFAEFAAKMLEIKVTEIDMKVLFNYQAARIDIQCSSKVAENININFYFEPGFPTRTFDPTIWDE